MPRSLKKGPFVDDHLLRKVEKAQESGDRRVIKTHQSSLLFVNRNVQLRQRFGQFSTNVYHVRRARQHTANLVTQITQPLDIRPKKTNLDRRVKRRPLFQLPY